MPRDSPSGPTFLRKVVRVANDGVLLHFYLACGHLISKSRSEVAGGMPTSVDCWACREEAEPKRH